MESQRPLSTCLFCNTSICPLKREAQKQQQQLETSDAVDNLTICGGDSDTDNHCNLDLDDPLRLSSSVAQDFVEYVGEFWRAFKLFCKLLGNESESQRKSVDKLLSMEDNSEDDESGGDVRNDLRRDQPCCRECHLALMNVLRLQLVVERSLARQRDCFEVLKLSITKNLDSHNPVLDPIWEVVRAQLIDCLNLKLTKREKKDANYIWDSSGAESNDASSPISIYGDASVDPLWLSAVGTTNSTLQEIPQLNNEVTGGGENSSQPQLARGLSADDSKKVKVDGGFTSPLKMKPCFVKLAKLSLEDVSGLRRSLQKPNNVRMTTRRRKGGKTKRKSKKKANVPYHFNDVFLRISEDILLFQCTPIRVSSAGFNCLEPGCTHVEGGSDYFTFQNMNTHILNYHEVNYECKETRRQCPLCDTYFTSGVSLRRHLISEHATGNKSTNTPVVCPSCFKTTHYSKHRSHLWLHKSVEEKAEAVASGEKIPQPQKRWFGPTKKKQNKVIEPEPIVDLKATANLKNEVKAGEQIKSKKRKRKLQYKANVEVEEEPLFYKLDDNLLMYKHILIQHTSTEFTCQVWGCRIGIKGSDYFAFQEFKTHVKTCHRPHITNSMDRYAQEPKYICPLCRAEFWEGEEFSSHIHSEHSPSPVCVSCWKPLEAAAEMEEHVKLHMNSEELLALSRPSDLRFRRVYPRKELPYTCKMCNKQFASTSSIWSHERTHVPKHLRPHFDCPECGMQLLSRVGLQAHIERKHRLNLGTRKRECHICKAQFYFRDGERYRIHMRGHTGETPWQCDLCGKRFSSQGQYAVHFKIHSNEQNYQCEFCAKRYKRRSALKLHQRKAHKGLVKELDAEQKLKDTHNLEHRPGFIGPKIAYPCEYCGKVFQIRSLLTKHLNKSHPQQH